MLKLQIGVNGALLAYQRDTHVNGADAERRPEWLRHIRNRLGEACALHACRPPDVIQSNASIDTFLTVDGVTCIGGRY